MNQPIAIRDAFGQALVKAGYEYDKVVAISCDLKGATKTSEFFSKFPSRSFEVGIAEANGIGIAAGLALSGYRPFISSFGAFITGKNVEIRTSIAYNAAPVVVVGTHGGLIGPDGTTQAGLQDITTMRAIPNFIIVQPASAVETKAMVQYLASTRQPAYLRIARNELAEIYEHDYKFILGKGHIIRDGTDITLISSGPPVHAAAQASDYFGSELKVRVVNMPSLKPIDENLISQCATETKTIMTIEDHSIEGGLGSMVSEVVTENGLDCSGIRHGIKDVFTESGTPSQLEEKYQLDSTGIIEQIKNIPNGN